MDLFDHAEEAGTEEGPLSIDEIAIVRSGSEMFTRLTRRFSGHEADTKWCIGVVSKTSKIIIKPETIGEMDEDESLYLLHYCNASIDFLAKQKEHRLVIVSDKHPIVESIGAPFGAAVRLRKNGVIIGVSGISLEVSVAVATNIAYSIGLPIADVEYIMDRTKFSMIYDLHALASKEKLV